jgi:hypothetical protein
MALCRDFRLCRPSKIRIRECGVYLGEALYPRLYFTENATRIIVHSVLTVQLPPPWPAIAIDADTAREILRVRASYLANPRNASAGSHDVYFLFLPKLSRIVRTNIGHFQQVIPTAQAWVAALDNVRLPRNLVGHMNWPKSFDRAAIIRASEETRKAFKALEGSRIPVLIP